MDENGNEPRIEFLTVPDVEAIHELQLEEFGGIAGVREPGLLDAAVAQPRMTFGGEFLHWMTWKS